MDKINNILVFYNSIGNVAPYLEMQRNFNKYEIAGKNYNHFYFINDKDGSSLFYVDYVDMIYGDGEISNSNIINAAKDNGIEFNYVIYEYGFPRASRALLDKFPHIENIKHMELKCRIDDYLLKGLENFKKDAYKNL